MSLLTSAKGVMCPEHTTGGSEPCLPFVMSSWHKSALPCVAVLLDAWLLECKIHSPPTKSWTEAISRRGCPQMKFTLKSINLAEKTFFSHLLLPRDTSVSVCVHDLSESLIFWAKSQMLHILPSHGVFQAWVRTADWIRPLCNSGIRQLWHGVEFVFGDFLKIESKSTEERMHPVEATFSTCQALIRGG